MGRTHSVSSTTISTFLIDHSQIPRRYANARLSDIRPQMDEWADKGLKYVRDFTLNPLPGHAGLWIESPNDVGVGKTHLACAILRGLAFEGKVSRQVTYYQFSSLMSALARDASGRATPEDETLLYRLTSSQVVVFDDIDKFTGTESAVYRLHQIVDRIWGDLLPVPIITTNTTPDTLITRLNECLHNGGAGKMVGQSIVSRIMGMCTRWVIPGGTTDHRQTWRNTK